MKFKVRKHFIRVGAYFTVGRLWEGETEWLSDEKKWDPPSHSYGGQSWVTGREQKKYAVCSPEKTEIPAWQVRFHIFSRILEFLIRQLAKEIRDKQYAVKKTENRK